MLKLDRSTGGWVNIEPRRPYHFVWFDEEVYDRIAAVNGVLAHDNLSVSVTRGFENEGRFLRWSHYLARLVGGILFLLLYPHRASERRQIFSANGHNESSRCIDVSVYRSEKKIVLLPYGVFTPHRIAKRICIEYAKELNHVWTTLGSFGFVIHPNLIESLQIHCELTASYPSKIGPN